MSREQLTDREAQRALVPRKMPPDFNPKFLKDGKYLTYDDGKVRLGFELPQSPEQSLKLVEALRIAVWRSLEIYRIRKLQ